MAKVKLPALQVRDITAAGLGSGVRLISHTYASWDISAKCERPAEVELQGQGHWTGTGVTPTWEPSRALAMKVCCRQCAACLKARRLLWARRAKAEFKASTRTWFGTLTFTPSERYKLLAETRQRLANERIDLGSLKDREQFRELGKTTGYLVRKFLWRLRKGNKAEGHSPCRFRYFISIEPHKDWFPHYHVMMHEVSELHPLRKRSIEHPWDYGFTQWRLVKDDRAATYAAKYLGKFSMARVRASTNYGKPPHALSIVAMQRDNTPQGVLAPPLPSCGEAHSIPRDRGAISTF